MTVPFDVTREASVTEIPLMTVTTPSHAEDWTVRKRLATTWRMARITWRVTRRPR